MRLIVPLKMRNGTSRPVSKMVRGFRYGARIRVPAAEKPVLFENVNSAGKRQFFRLSLRGVDDADDRENGKNDPEQ